MNVKGNCLGNKSTLQEHSMCQPGRPLPKGILKDGSFSFACFQSTKSKDVFFQPYHINTLAPASSSLREEGDHIFKFGDFKIYITVWEQGGGNCYSPDYQSYFASTIIIFSRLGASSGAKRLSSLHLHSWRRWSAWCWAVGLFHHSHSRTFTMIFVINIGNVAECNGLPALTTQKRIMWSKCNFP